MLQDIFDSQLLLSAPARSPEAGRGSAAKQAEQDEHRPAAKHAATAHRKPLLHPVHNSDARCSWAKPSADRSPDWLAAALPATRTGRLPTLLSHLLPLCPLRSGSDAIYSRPFARAWLDQRSASSAARTSFAKGKQGVSRLGAVSPHSPVARTKAVTESTHGPPAPESTRHKAVGSASASASASAQRSTHGVRLLQQR